MIRIENIAETEIKDIKIDLSESFTMNTYYFFIKKAQNHSSFNQADSIKTMSASDRIIPLGSLLPKEVKFLITYGLQNVSKSHPRVIYPEGYVNANGSSTIYHTGRFDEWITNFVTSSLYVQMVIEILSILGVIFLVKISYRISQFFINN